MNKEEIIQLATTMAWSANLLPPLVLAVVEQESKFNPWATRFEPKFYERYTKPMSLTDTEEYTRAISWGLMQVMGQTARESGFVGRYLSELCDPPVGLYFGCLYLRRCMQKAGGDTRRALLYYNGGGNLKYPDEVLEKMAYWKSKMEADGGGGA